MRIIGGLARRHRLKSPKGSDVRPTSDRVREALFNILSPRVVGSRFLDVFAGTGAVGIEALSRGASHSTLIERDPRTAALIRRNVEDTGLATNARVIVADARRALTELDRDGCRYDIVFFDPPYRMGLEEALLMQLEGTGLVEHGGVVVTESDSGHLPPDKVAGLWCWRRERYGDTTLSFYVRKEA